MQTEILCCLLGLAAGVIASRQYDIFAAKKQKPMADLSALRAGRLEKLLHNIESYDGTEKNQLQIGGEEE